jgi:hypothetical protein
MSKKTRENKDRPLAQLNTGQLVIRLGNRLEYARQLDEKIAVLDELRPQARARENFKDLKAKRKRAEDDIKLLRRRLEQAREAEAGSGASD